MEITVTDTDVNIIKVGFANSFFTTASISAQPGWLYLYRWVAEVFHTPACTVILLHDKTLKNGTSWDLVAV